ncbi:uncharacterized protein LOC110095747 [Dendrobium catenatum]|uniref:Putative E3 ubiquitin-protein ligase LUL3 n=1 Tax=Dendrobium catenatum TaxID=906689 RepID=A0A2I0XFA4_9ASPA|nr:uncharacterized protein LOC110095747 [Dendrobium catenatum]PKU86580.1 putative E3 ubiquitin-protein ligase LUL3 [Dendrobium catenatum]
MASSVARMPSDEWRHHHASRLHVRTHKPISKILTRISTSINTTAAAAAAAASAIVLIGGGGEPLSPATETKRRQSQILDRWAARQARDMITTIERQAHEAELSALSTTTQPVSARAASLLRETSPDTSVAAAVADVVGSGGGAVAADIQPTVRASSLIQMWRELEAEAGVCPTPRASMAAPPPAAEAEEALGGSDTSNEADAFCDLEKAAPSSPPTSSAVEMESEVTERRKVWDIIRMLSLQVSSSPASSGNKPELSAKEITGNTPAATLLPSSAPLPMPDTSKKALRVRGRLVMENFHLKLEKERRLEVAALEKRHPVSRFPFRGRIQSLIRLRSLRQEVATIKHQQWSQKLEAKRFETGSNTFFSREKPADRSELDIIEVPAEESLNVMEVQPSDPHVCVFAIPINHSNGENNLFPELASTGETESSPLDFYSPLSQHEDLQESRSSKVSWDEKSLWGSSLDWQRLSNSHSLQTWHGEIASEGTETSSQEQQIESPQCKLLLQPWVIRRTFYNDLLNTSFTENREIQELLEMKTVSTSLASEFSAKMNQMIESFLHRQGQQNADVIEREQYEEQGIWRQNYESSSDQEVAATSLSQLSSATLSDQEIWKNTSLSSSSQILQNQDHWQRFSLPLQKSWQSSSSTQNSSPSFHEGEDMHELKNSVAQIHHEISELRKLVESCLDWQKKLDHSIKQEAFCAVNQLAGRGSLLHNSKCMQGRKDNCCICCEAQVDTLLYRCGHMCACYKCAKELQWSCGRCPICRSLIADVVRAYPNS